MKRAVLVIGLLLALAGGLGAHDPNGPPVTWNRHISRLVYDRCASCHRKDGTSFSLMTYQEAQPRADAIKDAVLSRRMPPWGAVKGFGNFRNDQALTPEQIELITYWVEAGAPRGNNPNMLPPVPKFDPPVRFQLPKDAIPVAGSLTLSRAMTLDGLYPARVPPGASMQVVAELPNGDVEPLIWLYEYKDSHRHPFLLRKPLLLPRGTVISGLRKDARVFLIPGKGTTTK